MTTSKAYRSGAPFSTGAVINPPPEFHPIAQLSPGTLTTVNEKTVLTYALGDDDYVFGLGLNVGTVNRRGSRFELFNRSTPCHTPDLVGLYGSLPFLIVANQNRAFGIFIDMPGKIRCDIGFTRRDRCVIEIDGGDFDLYLFEADSCRSIVTNYLALVGAPVIPPKWAFGYQQCRYSYPDAETVERIAGEFRKREIPCDVIYMDIDYMQGYKCFTVDETAFPDLKGLARRLGKQGFKLVSIIDPGIKVEKGYDAYEEVIERDLCCVDKSGEPFVGAVWPGLTVFPDFYRAETRAWWKERYRSVVESGIRGFWNDMNEPEIMYSAESLAGLKETLKELSERTDLGTDPVGVLPQLWKWWGSPDFWSQFYHRDEKGTLIPHADVHNLYGTWMANATAEAVAELVPGKRPFVLSRSSYPGLHRTAVIWTGDNHSWWEHMKLHIQQLISLNLGGFFFTGPDIGGHNGEPSPELMVRWTQLGALTPLFRNHTIKNSRDQEPWEFGDAEEQMMRDAIRLRYALLPYLYSEYVRAVRELTPFVTPLFMHYSGNRAFEVEDQFFVGESLLAAPVITAGSTGRFVHLPEGKWLAWCAERFEERSCTVIEGGDRYVEAPLSRMPLFLRENRLVVMTDPKQYTDAAPDDRYLVIGLVTAKAAFEVVIDDGESTELNQGLQSSIHIRVERENGAPLLQCGADASSSVSDRG